MVAEPEIWLVKQSVFIIVESVVKTVEINFAVIVTVISTCIDIVEGTTTVAVELKFLQHVCCGVKRGRDVRLRRDVTGKRVRDELCVCERVLDESLENERVVCPGVVAGAGDGGGEGVLVGVLGGGVEVHDWTEIVLACKRKRVKTNEPVINCKITYIQCKSWLIKITRFNSKFLHSAITIFFFFF